jgi:hypothetical protein
MAIKSGQILTDANGYVIDRIQNAGPGNLNIPQEKIYELGNDKTVATIYDIPDLSFSLESFDTTTEFETVLIGKDPTTFSSTPGSNEIDFINSVPLDVISPFKSKKGAYDVVKGIIVPYLTLEQVTYRFGLRQNANQSFTLRGDSIYYCPAKPYYEEVTISSGPGPYTLAGGRSATVYTEGANTIHVLCVTLFDSTGTLVPKRCMYDAAATSGFFYSDTTTSFTLADDPSDSGSVMYGYDKAHIVYSSAAAVSYTATGNNPNGHAVVQNVSVKPAAVRPKDIDVYVSNGAATPTWSRLTGVQSAEVTRRVNLQNDEEFGNAHYVGQDYETADVNGSVGFKPLDPADLLAKLHAITGVNTAEVIGPNISTPIGMEIHINHPSTGSRLKTIYVEDARFTVPGLNGRVQQKLETTLSFNSDEGNLKVYNGKRRSGSTGTE